MHARIFLDRLKGVHKDEAVYTLRETLEEKETGVRSETSWQLGSNQSRHEEAAEP